MRKPAKTFQDLVVWQKAHAFVLEVYQYTESFPESELYGLTSQFRRAAVSIAEGFKKRGRKDKARYMNIAQGSLEECRYYIILAQDLNYGTHEDLDKRLQTVSKMIESYRKAVLSS